jgi:hypothetical protein
MGKSRDRMQIGGWEEGMGRSCLIGIGLLWSDENVLRLDIGSG